jgi:hypothetical protein
MQIFARAYNFLKRTPAVSWWGFGISVLVIICLGLAWPKAPRDSETVKNELALIKKNQQALINERDALKQALSANDATIREYARKDSALAKTARDQRLIIQEINRKYESLNIVDKFTARDIQQYFANEYGQR